MPEKIAAAAAGSLAGCFVGHNACHGLGFLPRDRAAVHYLSLWKSIGSQISTRYFLHKVRSLKLFYLLIWAPFYFS